MGFQTGIFQVYGSFGIYTCCRNGVVRARRRSDLFDFHNSPTREPNRQDSSEFGRGSNASGLLRYALPDHLPARHHSRLTGALRRVIALDATHARGQRQLLPEYAGALTGFVVNPAAPALPASLRSGCTLKPSPAAGKLALTLPALLPGVLSAPAGATHYSFAIGAALLDPIAGTCRPVTPGPRLGPAPRPLCAASAARNITLSLPTATTDDEILFVVLGVRFYAARGSQPVLLPATAASPLAIAYAGPVPAFPLPAVATRLSPAETVLQPTLKGAISVVTACLIPGKSQASPTRSPHPSVAPVGAGPTPGSG